MISSKTSSSFKAVKSVCYRDPKKENTRRLKFSAPSVCTTKDTGLLFALHLYTKVSHISCMCFRIIINKMHTII